MKAYLILCFLLASLLFFPSSLLARELAADAGKGHTGGTGNTNKPTKPCGPSNPGTPYCKGNGNKPSKPCGNRYKRGCPPNSGH
ncbi:hypothetical protein TIFTF001_038788 [Ficus carica]|uniref:Rapid ALkalinization Factor n=1 Tax=Ficus carica TaxID=3494 RepID=A0AA88E8L9_FICCA|nr:hypothetical protein TIFTF001_038788 [Ficus carica]